MLKIFALLFLSFISIVPSKAQINLYFDFDKSNLKQAELAKLDAIVFNKDSIVTITAHTDTFGTIQYNKQLAKKRLQTVLNYLLINQSFAVSTLVVGETKDSSYDHLNRRVSIQLISKLTALPSPKSDTPKTLVKQRFNFNKIYFYPSTPIIKPESKETLKELLETVKKLAGEKIELRGHINHPSWYGPISEEHRQLSYNRAKAVYEYLKSNAVDVSNISIKGMSNTEMVYPNPNNMNEMELNMRVEVVVLY